jgi:hypothetical protein
MQRATTAAATTYIPWAISKHHLQSNQGFERKSNGVCGLQTSKGSLAASLIETNIL